MHHIEQISDQKLFKLCEKYGTYAKLWRQRFAGLLPEVYRRRLYEKKGFGSIFEFAAKLAGMSEEQVSRVLNLHERFEGAPMLRKMLENGDVSINKLARVASVVTKENEQFWADQVRLLAQPALETLVRDARLQSVDSEVLPDNDFNEEFVRSHKLEMKLNSEQGAKSPTDDVHAELNLSPEVHQKLLGLQQRGIDINNLLKEFLEKRELELAREKEQLAGTAGEIASRYIPVRIKQIIKKEYGTKCSAPGCMRDAKTIHHTQRFALAKNHNPQFLAPLCHEHHQIAHSIDVRFQEMKGRA